ncbi:dTDP-4-dehydrorhamnose reductase [Paenibacillus sp. Leaf72]|uniref:dTDP-4-dehydrorhamnose reductase n=1 Tax=Paenibacillus sp. Leaf72 TaxID=1736234 RepID=UPI0006FC7C6F|nr:dTDP-4-dehydrorhamnose reductase [Paenibacillus sp. Leaf72]KQO15379.1 NAD(P)-dependent oxidoreductase [Paenibacillus sp. Leaf72]
MKVLVTGAKGLLGHDIVQFLESQGTEFYGLDRQMLDISDMDKTAEFIRNYLPSVVIHCAAFTNVDKAESHEAQCRLINVDATANIAKVCKEINAKLVYISTDYVFSGEEKIPYEVYSKTKPLSVYGQTKLDGEIEVLQNVEKHFIIRTSWSFGVNGNNFVSTMLKLSENQGKINVVADQIGSPTFTEDLAMLIVEMIKTEKYGVYHVTNEGFCSWAEFATEIFRQAGYSTTVNFIKSSEYPTIVKRPSYSNLSKATLDHAGFGRLPTWQDALGRYLNKIGIS